MVQSENKYFMIYRVTKSILLGPFAFGETIGDTAADTKRATRYLGEGVIFCFAIYQVIASYQETANFMTELPFAGEILAAGLIGTVMLTGLFTHPVASFFSGNSRAIHASLTSFLYWTGFSIFVMWPIIALIIIGSTTILASLPINPGWLLWIMMGFLVPFILVYYVGTLSSWIGSAYGMETMMGGLAIMFSYTISMAVGMGIYAVVSFIGAQFS